MDSFNTFNLEREKFANFVVDFVSRDTFIFFRDKKKHPLDRGCIRLLSLYSYIFFDASHETKPSIQEMGLFLDKGNDIASLYQDACYWYDRWKGMDDEARCISFCEELNSVILKKAREVSTDSWLLLPDFRARRDGVRRRVRFEDGLFSDEKEKISSTFSA